MIRVCWIVLLLATGSLFAEPNEKGLWQVWELHVNQTDDHAAVLAECIAFAKLDPKDPLVPVSNTLAAWHLLAIEKRVEAAKLLSLYTKVGGNSINDHAAVMAQSWLTRLDRELIRETLQFYYRKEIKYPRTLKELKAYPALPPEMLPTETDRFGQAWKYKLAGFTRIPGLLDQKYELLSAKLGIDSDLKESMAWPYASRIRMVPVKMQPTGVEMNRGPIGIEGPQDTFVLGSGKKMDGVTLAFAGRHLLILCDRDHWKVMPRP